MHPPRVAVAISTYQSKKSVLGLLQQSIDEQWPLDHFIVVDSFGTDEIERFGRASALRGRFSYRNSPTNLGAAGNLYERLEIASALGMDFVLALNDDAIIDRTAIEALLAHTRVDNVGALYPLRFREGKGVYDLTGVLDFNFRVKGVATPPTDALIPVAWGSSNGALYSIRAFREGQTRPDRSLWHGWEDYAFGLALRQAGYGQYIVSAARTTDNYEYKEARLLGGSMSLADKPSWTVYYSIRNRLLVNLHRTPSLLRAGKTLVWCMLMLGPSVVLLRSRSQGVNPLRAYVSGFIDGLRNRGGKWIHPADPRA
jgi:GT2 family glycosyltransferase